MRGRAGLDGRANLNGWRSAANVARMTTQEPEFDSARAIEAAHELMRVSRALDRVELTEVIRLAEEEGGEVDSEDENNLLAVRMFDVLLEFLNRFDPNFDPYNTPYIKMYGLGDDHQHGDPLWIDGPGRSRNLPKTDLATYLQHGESRSKGKGLGKGSKALSKGLGKGSKGLGKTPSSGTDWSLVRAYGVETHRAHGGFAYRSY